MNPFTIWTNAIFTIFAFLTIISANDNIRAEEPLHKRIDALIGVGNPDFEQGAAEPASDAEFFRRIHLDLTGCIPSTEQTRDFLSDDSPHKRADLIDRLLASPRHARRMQYVFDVMLMERQPPKHVKEDKWREYLRQSFANNKPWDQLAEEILTADGTEESTRPAARFFLDRELKTEEVVRDLGRIFLGRDLQCAQCHDHPMVYDYLQRHYHGLAAFFNRSYLFTDPKTKQKVIGEKAEGVVKFTSVFTNESGQTPPRLLDLPAIEEPAVAGEAYRVKPDKKSRGVPVFSRRLKLAPVMTSDTNVDFRENIANRLWAMMMGQGLVDPVDMRHESNPPSHPELLTLLADSLREHGYDMRYLLRELALTKTYQRSSRHPDDSEPAEEDRFAVAILKPLSPEQLAWSIMTATGLTAETWDDLKAKTLKADSEKGPEKINDPVWREQALHDALKKHVDVFVRYFGKRGIQTARFDASANQALFLKNGSLLQSWLKPSGNNLTARLLSRETPELIDELFLAVFSRKPTEDEVREITRFLESHQDDREPAVRQLVWAAVTSAEFRFNH